MKQLRGKAKDVAFEVSPDELRKGGIVTREGTQMQVDPIAYLMDLLAKRFDLPSKDHTPEMKPETS